MIKSNFHSALLLVFFCCGCCKKEEVSLVLSYDDLLLLNSRFECVMPSFEPSTYFKGKIGDKELCYYDGVADLYTINQVYSNTVSITNSPEMILNGNNSNFRKGNTLGLDFHRKNYVQYETTISIATAFSTKDSTMKQYVDKYFTKSTITILDKENAGAAPHENKEGFLIHLFTVEKVGQSKVLLTTMAGRQNKNNYIKVKSMQKIVVFGKTYCDIVLDIKCDLYKSWEVQPQFYATLEGEYATRLLYE